MAQAKPAYGEKQKAFTSCRTIKHSSNIPKTLTQFFIKYTTQAKAFYYEIIIYLNIWLITQHQTKN
ncbi:hypothetical protein DJ52_14065 [Brachyspira murdochii]|uniref:Uncharacterized protein n=1 Tax=Brachyspira murdochii TaxID=84378 RepID=A0ABX5B142_9SPIR|nr:hypothetical protein DJ52_14065 [Brachyspira murdochii]